MPRGHLALSDKKCRLMCRAGVVLSHLIYDQGVQVGPTKIDVIIHQPIPETQRDVRGFLGHAGYYQRFIEKFSNITAPLFLLLAKDSDFS